MTLWMPIPGYELHYSVSDQGQVRREARFDSAGHLQAETLLRGGRHTSGYVTVTLRWPTTRRTYVHALVLEAFDGPPPDGFHGCHYNGDPSDNRLANLRWGSPSDNATDQVRHGRHFHASKTVCDHGHRLQPPNLYRRDTSTHRACLACRRARTYLHQHPELSDFQTLADYYFQQLTSLQNDLQALDTPVHQRSRGARAARGASC